MITALGRSIIVLVIFSADIVGMLADAVRDALHVVASGNDPVRRVFFKQVYFTGLQALGIVLTIAVVIGTVVTTQVMSFAGNESGPLAGKVLMWVVVREVAPLLTAFIVVARSGTAIATELGQMKQSGEIESLESMGISPARYLIMPRVCGVTVSVLLLACYFSLACLAGGFLVVSLGWRIPVEELLQGVTSAVTVSDLAQLFTKSICYGLAIALACCRQGLGVGASATEIPQAATRAIIQSVFAIFVLEGILTFFFQ